MTGRIAIEMQGILRSTVVVTDSITVPAFTEITPTLLKARALGLSV